MSDYKEQANSLREHADLIETSIELYGPSATRLLVYDLRNAAAAIEDLQAKISELGESYSANLVAAQNAQPHWVSVEDELPKPNIQCLVRDDDNNCAVGYYRQDARAWDSPFFGWVERDDEYYEDGDLCRIGKVVAWMPIESPKEDAR